MSKADDIGNLCDAYSSCTNCRLHKRANKRVFGKGSIDASILIVGIAPGEVEDEKGLPFVGPSGILLQEILHAAGIGKYHVYMTNLVMCRPFEIVKDGRGKDIRKNRDPSDKERKACSERLNAEIYAIDPKIIVGVGKPVLRHFLKKQDLKNLRGRIITININGKKGKVPYGFIPTWHPSYLLRQCSMLEGDPRHNTLVDFEKAAFFAHILSKHI